MRAADDDEVATWAEALGPVVARSMKEVHAPPPRHAVLDAARKVTKAVSPSAIAAAAKKRLYTSLQKKGNAKVRSIGEL